MNRKKLIGTILITITILIIIAVAYYFTREDKNALTVTENQWIQENKNVLIDLSIPNDVSVLSNNGEGIVFDFLNDLEEDTSLEFNKLSYSISNKPSSNYAVTVTDKVKSNEILIYRDSYALVTKTKIKYTNVNEIKNIVIGVLENDMTKVSKYLDGSGEVSYKSYKNITDMVKGIETDLIDAIVVPKLENLNEIISNENLNIAYNITEYTKDYVISLGTNEKLNKILTKYYNKWQTENFDEKFTNNLIKTYFSSTEMNEKSEVQFRSKRYSYGFVVNGPYDVITKDGVRGFNHSLLSNFEKASNIEIDYKKYSNIESLINDFSSNKLDIVFNYQSQDKYNMDVYNTVSIYSEDIVIISNKNTDLTVNNINSLAGQTVSVVKNSKIEKHLTNHNTKVETYNNIDDLISHLNNNDLAAIDYNSYDYYVRTNMNDFIVLGTLNLDDEYNFISRDISANKTFNELFDFYLSFENTDRIINNSYKELLEYNHSNKLLQTLLIIFSAILLILIGILTGKFIKRRKTKHKKLSKVDKLRYVDTMTSLKNRNYLNDNIDAWDNTDVYPQAIIIIDLNNVAYINDNFGHSEGDKVIIEGAGILIANQLPNSEIIRTNGNEFLIFMIGQDEKSVVTYIRKLHKEFKNISHGFGAAIGYSMIVDEIKTIDDAVNEATSDMRNNKEDK